MRPPYAGNAKIVYGFRRSVPKNFGYTLEIPVGGNVIAPADGSVELIQPSSVGWRYTSPALKGGAILIRINHGYGVKTYIHGVANPSVGYGQVTRGQVLGTSAYGEVFFAVEVFGSMTNPSRVNSFFAPRSGNLYAGQSATIRQAPNVGTWFVSALSQVWYNGLRYFTTPQPFFVNVDFNGGGSKAGLAAVGYAETDYWNVLVPLAGPFGYASYTTDCGPTAYTWTAEPSVPLLDYRGKPSKVSLRRVIEDNFYGSSAEFDPMLSTYYGGWSGSTPRQQWYDIRGLAPGSYDIYVYANQKSGSYTSIISMAVAGSLPTTKVPLSTTQAAWIEDYNYVKFTKTLGVGDYLTFEVLGYIGGLQITRS